MTSNSLQPEWDRRRLKFSDRSIILDTIKKSEALLKERPAPARRSTEENSAETAPNVSGSSADPEGVTTSGDSNQNPIFAERKLPAPQAVVSDDDGSADGVIYVEHPFSDDRRAHIKVWMETEDDVYTENEDYLTANREAVRRSEEYKHHHYDGQQWSTRERSHGRKDAEWFIPEPEVADDSDPEYLCEMCRHIDFRVVFTRRGVPGNIEPGVSAIKIRAPSVLQASNCSFCSLIRQGFQTQWTQKEMEIAENAERIGMQLAVLDDGPESALRLEVTLADGFTDMKPRLVLQMMTPESTIPLRGLPVDREVADMGRLRTWIQTCEEHHTDEVNKFEPSTWRFIDVEEERIASAEATCRYTCLSYVWGHKKGTQLTTETLAILEKPGGLRDSSVALGKTLRNAMKVTKDIGIRYLWIDALCIIQNDAEDKRRCISRMSHIYGNATVNIVASTNSCPSEGLPGVGDTPRIRAQVVRKLQGITLSAAFHDPRLPLEGIEGSVWNSRAWTFQERHLSPRSVYFTDSQMYFTCRHEVVFEDTVPGLPEDHQPRQLLDTSQFRGRIWDIVPFISLDPTQAYYPNKTFHIHGQGSQAKNIISDDPSIPAPIYHAEPALIPAGGGFLRIHGETMWKAYADAVGMYTGRKMTWQTDALNAFHGVSDLLAQGVNTTFWHGLPEYNFDQALLWYPREPLRRRNHEGASPSWSWAGWEGHTGYRGRGWYNALAMPPVTVIKWLRHKTPRDLIYDYLTDGKHHTPEEIADQAFLIARQQSKVFYINIPTLFHFDPDDNWTHCRDTERNEHYYTHPEYPGLRFTYPTTLPSQKIIPKAQVHGFLFFQARHVPVSFVDITKTPHNPAPRVDHFLQIGKTNPAIQGRTRFRPWEHAIYHQGYRAGFLSLNVPLSDLDVPGDEGAAAVDTASSNASKYHIVPISRESLPSIAPPVEGWEEYWNSNPRYQQSVVMKWEWGREEQRWQAVGPSEEAQKPYRGQCLENGDPRWDVARFGLPVELDVYNVLLLEKLPGGNYKRVGVGKMNAHAFWHAHPEEGIFVLS